MECDVCTRAAGSHLPLYCPSCVRTILYDLRIRKAQTLLEQEQLTSQIEALTAPKEVTDTKIPGGTTKQGAEEKLKWSLESNNVERARAKERTQIIQKHNQILRDEIKVAREDIARRKAALQEKRKQQETLKNVVTDRWNRRSTALREEIKKVTRSWDVINNKAVETRRFLCREAAHLCGLKQRKKVKGGLVRDQYWVAGMPVTVLRDLNGAKSNELTISLTNLARLIILVSFYLSVRLPAELILPQRDHPLPKISTPANSYQGRDTRLWPATTSSSNSHVESRSGAPRPRPLFIELENLKDKLPHLAKTDPAAFSFFLEGISLLAWDVAWLCRSQGMISGTESWEDVCNMGRNLWNLLIAPPQSPTLLRVMSGRDTRQDHKAGTQETTTATAALGSDRSLKLGHFSHDSAHSFSDNVGADPVRGWRLTKYTMIVDPLKKALLGEMSNAEWEVLEQDEWDDGGEQFREHEAVFIKNQSSSEAAEGKSSFDDARSRTDPHSREERAAEKDKSANEVDRNIPLSTIEETNAAAAAAAAAAAPGKAKGTSGWTKLKNRDKRS